MTDAAQETVIDLGLLGPDGSTDDAHPADGAGPADQARSRPARQRWRDRRARLRDRWAEWRRDRWAEWRTRWDRHRWWALAALVPVVGLLAGSAPPGQVTQAVIPLVAWAKQGSLFDQQIILTPGLVVVPTHLDGRAASYALHTGEQLWTTDDVLTGQELIEVDGLLLELPGSRARDLRTGEVVWTSDWLRPPVGAEVGLQIVNVPDAEPDPRRPVAQELQGVDLATGEVRWRQRVELGLHQWWLTDPSTVVTNLDGAVQLLDLATGEVRWERALPADPPGSLVAVEDGVLVVQAWTGERSILRGYRFDSAAPIWEQAGPEGSGEGVRCGQLLCLVSLRLGEVFVQPATERQTDPDAADPATVPPEAQGSPSIIWMEVDPGDGGAGPGISTPFYPEVVVTILDPATGEALWTHVGPHDPSGQRRWEDGAEVREAVWGYAREQLPELAAWRLPDWEPTRSTTAGLQQLVLLPAEGRAGGASVAVLDLRTLTLMEHDWAPPDPEFCLAIEGRLACRYADELLVWSW